MIIQYSPTPRLGLNLDASYLGTHTPGELNVGSQIAVDRSRAERIALLSAATYDWSLVTKVSGEYAVTRDTLAGAIASVTYSSRIGVERQTGVRNTY